MMGLSDSERISMIRSAVAVLIQYTSVTDGQTDGQTDGIGVAYTALSIASRGNEYVTSGYFPVSRHVSPVLVLEPTSALSLTVPR